MNAWTEIWRAALACRFALKPGFVSGMGNNTSRGNVEVLFLNATLSFLRKLLSKQPVFTPTDSLT